MEIKRKIKSKSWEENSLEFWAKGRKNKGKMQKNPKSKINWSFSRKLRKLIFSIYHYSLPFSTKIIDKLKNLK